ncbi:MAG: hypothetical protein AABZ44_00140, partial [Elusimicrobiota bacterium]
TIVQVVAVNQPDAAVITGDNLQRLLYHFPRKVATSQGKRSLAQGSGASISHFPRTAALNVLDRSVVDEEIKKSVNVDKGKLYLAERLAEELNDANSLGFYKKISSRIAHGIIYQALDDTKHADSKGTIRTRKGQYFTDRVKRLVNEAENNWEEVMA